MMIANKEKFQEVETRNIEKFINYNQYGAYGFRLLFIPSPISVYFSNSGVVSELTAFVDSGIRLRIYKSHLGKNLYTEKSGSLTDFFSIVLLLGSLISIFWGYDTLGNREYIKFLSSILDHRLVYFSIMAARFIFFSLFFLFIIGISLLLTLLNNVSLSPNELSHLAVHSAILLILFLFFFFVGVLGGSLKAKSSGIIILIIIWFLFMFLLPGAVNKALSRQANKITSAYNLEQKKLILLSKFEKKALDDAQRYTNMEVIKEKEREFVDDYWNNEFQEILSYEEAMQRDMKENLKYYQKLSLIFPTTFYMSVHKEIGSRGYENFFNFYHYIRKLQQEFVRFYFKKRYYSNYSTIESFIKGDENLFYATSKLPGYFKQGLLIMLLYTFLVIAFSYYRFRQYLFTIPDKEGPDPNKLDLRMNKGESVVLLTTAKSIIDPLYTIFSGPVKNFKGRVKISGTDLAKKKDRKKEDFVYLCQPEKIPGSIRVLDFLSFFRKIIPNPSVNILEIMNEMDIGNLGKKRFLELEDKEKGKILIAAARMKEARLYIIHDFVKGMPIDFIIEFKAMVKKLKSEGASILYLTNDVLLASKISDRVTYLINDPSLPLCLDNYTDL